LLPEERKDVLDWDETLRAISRNRDDFSKEREEGVGVGIEERSNSNSHLMFHSTNH
jgi:hypothetical protein